MFLVESGDLLTGRRRPSGEMLTCPVRAVNKVPCVELDSRDMREIRLWCNVIYFLSFGRRRFNKRRRWLSRCLLAVTEGIFFFSCWPCFGWRPANLQHSPLGVKLPHEPGRGAAPQLQHQISGMFFFSLPPTCCRILFRFSAFSLI